MNSQLLYVTESYWRHKINYSPARPAVARPYAPDRSKQCTVTLILQDLDGLIRQSSTSFGEVFESSEEVDKFSFRY